MAQNSTGHEDLPVSPQENTSAKVHRTRKQGFLFAVCISQRWLMICLFRIIPIRWLRLSEITSVRKWSTEEVNISTLRGFRRYWNTEHWPSPYFRRRHEPVARYLIITRDRKKRVRLTLPAGMHYRIRLAINRANLGE